MREETILDEHLRRSGSDLAEDRAYWSDYRHRVDDAGALFTPGPEDADVPEAQASLDPVIARRLLQICRGKAESVYLYLSAVFAILAGRYFDRSAVVIGVIGSGERHPGVLPLVCPVEVEASFRDYLVTLRHQLDEHRRHALPIFLQGSLPVTQAALLYSPLHGQAVPWQTGADLELIAGSLEEPMSLTIRARTAHPFPPAAFLAHFVHLLDRVTTDAAIPMRSIALVADGPERQQLASLMQGRRQAVSPDGTLVDLLAEQVDRTPHAVALLWKDEQYSYEQLWRRAGILALRLQQLGAGPEKVTGLCMQRGPQLLIAVLAILRAGGAYLPIDPAYPAERIALMLDDAQASIVLSDGDSRPRVEEALAFVPGLSVACRLAHVFAPHGEEDAASAVLSLNQPLQPHHLAYLIYTSGSTGKPKGVMIEHRNVYSFLRWCHSEFASTAHQVVYAGTSICFDLSVFELFYPLTAGRPLRLLVNGIEAADFLGSDRGILLNAVPAVVQALLRLDLDWTQVRAINMAGEPIAKEIVDHLDCDAIEVRNLYGPTETTTYSTVYRLTTGGPMRIGSPIDNTTVYIVNSLGHFNPIGVAGEIYIGGAGVTRGYCRRPELTAERFLPDPAGPGTIYRTGDTGRWMADGRLEYLGRHDGQIKIRGYRIETGEIERVLEATGMVSQAVVAARSGSDGALLLVGYITAPAALREEALEAALARRLPDFMIPAVWVRLEEWPRTSNGKIDRKALPGPEIGRASGAPYVAPRNSLELQLAALWQDLLRVPRVGIQDNFFRIGGHSLLALRLAVSIQDKMGLKVSVADILRLSDVERLAAFLRSSGETGEAAAGVADVPAKSFVHAGKAYYEVTPVQKYWIDEEKDREAKNRRPSMIYILTTYRMEGRFDLECAVRAIQYLVGRHESLRSTFHKIDGAYLMRVEEPLEERYMPHYKDMAALAATETVAGIRESWIAGQVLKLDEGPLFTWSVIRRGAEDYVLDLLLHHVISDAWSRKVLIGELLACYTAYANGSEPAFVPLSYQYKELLALANHRERTTKEADRRYWFEHFPLLPDDFRLPVRRKGGKTRPRTEPAGRWEYVLGESEVFRIRELSREFNATLFVLLQATFNAFVLSRTGQCDICVATIDAGRPSPEFDGQIGCYAGTDMIRTKLAPGDDLASVILKVKRANSDVAAHRGYSMWAVLDGLVPPERDYYSFWKIKMLFFDDRTFVEQRGAMTARAALRLRDMPDERDEDASPETPAPAELDLILSYFDNGMALRLSAVYDGGLYDTGDMEDMLRDYGEFLRSALADIHLPVEKIL